MKGLVKKKYILLYLAIFFIFRFTFSKITSYYINPNAADAYPIDVRVIEGLKQHRNYCFDAAFVEYAKQTTYNISRYYRSFLPLDLVFPFFYSLLFLSCLSYCKHAAPKTLLTVLIVMGAVADWLEDSSFALFLHNAGNGLSSFVAFFTTIKTFLIIVNILVASIWMLVALKQILVKRKLQFSQVRFPNNE